MNFRFAKAINYQGGEYGNAILTSFEIKESKVVGLLGKEKRSALCLTLLIPENESPSQEFVFIATHLDTTTQPRLDSVDILEDSMKTYQDLPIVLAGDINDIPKSDTL